MGVRPDRAVAGNGAVALLFDQEAPGRRLIGVRHYSEGIHHAQGADDAFLRPGRQADQSKDRALHTLRMGQDNAGSTFRVCPRDQSLPLRGVGHTLFSLLNTRGPAQILAAAAFKAVGPPGKPPHFFLKSPHETTGTADSPSPPRRSSAALPFRRQTRRTRYKVWSPAGGRGPSPVDAAV